MRYKLLLTILWIGCCTTIQAQTNPFLKDFQEFRQGIKSDYQKFLDEANRGYVALLRGEWIERKVTKPVEQPLEDKVKPIKIKPEEVIPVKEEPVKEEPVKEEPVKEEPVEETPVKEEPAQDVPVKKEPVEVKVTPVELPEVIPQPTPVVPIAEIDDKKTDKIDFNFYGTPMSVRLGKQEHYKVTNCEKDGIADAWEAMVKEDYSNTLVDCLSLREKYKLNDWAYLQMLDSLTTTCFGGKSNESVMLMSYFYQQSGYDMRIGNEDGKLHMLFATYHVIYDEPYYTFDNKNYFIYGKKDDRSYLQVCNAGFPHEKRLSLVLTEPVQLAYQPTTARRVTAEKYREMDVEYSVNKNIIDFYNSYPSSRVGDNKMTRWGMLAKTPLFNNTGEQLTASLKEKIDGMSQRNAVERLLNWVQTGFEYEFDETIWGKDRAFFPEETLFYPYDDCEDRSILLSRLITDLLGLECLLVYYPGHLAMAVHFDEDIKGDYIDFKGKRYIVCDPTYIGASIGMTMPDMDNSTAEVVVIKK